MIIIESKNFNALSQYTTSSTKIRWIECGPTDGEPITNSPNRMIKILNQNSKNNSISVYESPVVVDLADKGERFTTVIETDGWSEGYPFMGLSFVFITKSNQWRWFGVCFDTKPPYDEIHGVHREYPKKPMAPRLDPK